MAELHDRLPPLWVERLEQAGFFKDIASIGLSDLRWSTLMKEAAQMQEEIDRGAPWPPPEFERFVTRKPDDMPRYFDPESFLGFFALPSILRGISTLSAMMASMGAPREFQQATMATTVHELYHLTRFKHYGRKVYVLDQETFDLLKATDLPDLPIGYLKPPMPEFYLVFPENTGVSLSVIDDPQPLEGALVSFPDLEETIFGTQAREISILLTARSPKGGADDNVRYMSGSLRADAPISDIAVHELGRWKEFSEIIRIILGTCLYLSSEHPHVEPVAAPQVDLSALKSRRKREKAEKRLAKQTRLSYVRIRAHADEGARSVESARKLEHTVWVRGHWRNQAYGEGRQLRRWIWIKPHQRGPDMAEAVGIKLGRLQQGRAS